MLGAHAIDYALRRVTVHGRAAALTATEYESLRTLSVHAGRTATDEPYAYTGRALGRFR